MRRRKIKAQTLKKWSRKWKQTCTRAQQPLASHLYLHLHIYLLTVSGWVLSIQLLPRCATCHNCSCVCSLPFPSSPFFSFRLLVSFFDLIRKPVSQPASRCCVSKNAVFFSCTTFMYRRLHLFRYLATYLVLTVVRFLCICICGSKFIHHTPYVLVNRSLPPQLPWSCRRRAVVVAYVSAVFNNVSWYSRQMTSRWGG